MRLPMSFFTKIPSFIINAYNRLHPKPDSEERFQNLTKLLDEAIKLSERTEPTLMSITFIDHSVFLKIDKIYNQVIKHIEASKNEKLPSNPPLNLLIQKITTLESNLNKTTIKEPIQLISRIFL